MNKRSYGSWLLLALFLIAGGVALALRPANSSTANLEKVVPNFSLRDTDGRQVALADFNGMLFYQRRLNTQTVNIQGSGSSTKLNGTMYAKWANFKLARLFTEILINIF